MSEIIVIKCGGSMIDTLTEDFFQSIKQMQSMGMKPIIVHGGGPAINKMLNELNIQSEFVNGLRKTSNEVLNVAEMILSGTMTNQLVRELNKYQIQSIGMTGSDGQLLQAKAIDVQTLGLVGEIVNVNQPFLSNLLSLGLVPVISPLAVGTDGAELYNINADSAAAAIAVAMNASKLLFITDVQGVLHGTELIEHTTSDEVLDLIDEGVIYGGMIPKVMAAVHSLEGGLSEVMIVSGYTNFMEGEKIKGTAITKQLGAVK